MNFTLEHALLGCAGFQIVVATANLTLKRILRWQPDFDRMPLLLRQVFHVHSWYISVTLTLFAVLTARFAAEMARGENEPLRWLAGAIAIFWTLRVGLQLGYYSTSHWRGIPTRTAIHVASLVGFGAMATCYWSAAVL
jgi:hypothetical protein